MLGFAEDHIHHKESVINPQSFFLLLHTTKAELHEFWKMKCGFM